MFHNNNNNNKTWQNNQQQKQKPKKEYKVMKNISIPAFLMFVENLNMIEQENSSISHSNRLSEISWGVKRLI